MQARRVRVVDQRLVVTAPLRRRTYPPRRGGCPRARARAGSSQPTDIDAEEQRRNRAAPAPPARSGAGRATLADERLDQQEQEGQRERDLVARVEAAFEGALELAFLERGDVVAVELRQAEPGAGGVQVDAAGIDRDALERRLVEPRLDHLALAILEEAPVLARDELALRCADADGEDVHAALLGARDRSVEIALVALAVGDQHDRLVVALASLEGLEAGIDRRCQRGASARDDADLDGVETLQERAPIEGERALEERRARESHQAETVAAGLGDEIADRELGAGEAVGLHVGREHAARGVERDHQVDSLALHLLPAESPHRAGQGDDHQGRRRDDQPRAQRAPAGIDVGCDGRLQRRRHELCQRAGASPRRPDEKRGQHRHQHQQRQAGRITPRDHGSLRSTVSPSPTSRSRRPSAGQRSHG